MLDITSDDILKLNDTDLRTLIGRLCEAELSINHLSTAGVTYGGNQDAKDGGLDVQVNIVLLKQVNGYIPNANTGYQVKKPKMPPSAIKTEMRPDGNLRQSIVDLVNCGGAYIIVSSNDSCSNSALISRKNAMTEALYDCPNKENLIIDFYDCNKIASWVRSHSSLILWVRDKIGRPINGWQSYGNWSHSPNELNSYIIDNHIRIYSSELLSGVSAEDGINHVRNKINTHSSAIRLVGLSGVGKTRLLQALFDESIGTEPLNKSIVFYTDIGNEPNPDPRSFAEQLLALNKKALLAIDNCPPELHRKLTEICFSEGSLVSLITVEYDVREDQPEETQVIRLEPASSQLIEKLIHQRYKNISNVNAHTIAEFSGGNAKIAFALCNTIRGKENIGELNDEVLFEKLFNQRKNENHSLLKAAKVCSLLYSFDIRTDNGTVPEIEILGQLVSMTGNEIFEHVNEMEERDLVQKRGYWRAVLPHAIANKLAQKALKDIPYEYILTTIKNSGSSRLLKSFSRRLGYLHETEIAYIITKQWLSDGGLLGDITNLNDIGLSIFRNIAPINPTLTLSAIERAAVSDDFFENEKNNEFVKIIRQLAYDADLFERAVLLIKKFANHEKPNTNYYSPKKVLSSLFYVHYSGTHASSEQRKSLIEKFINSEVAEDVDIGFTLLAASLETHHFDFYDFEFGARSRDYGLKPKDFTEYEIWFNIFIELTTKIAVSISKNAEKAKACLASSFRGLWRVGLYNSIEKASQVIIKHTSWERGWGAVRETKNYDRDKMTPEVFERLDKLDKLLKPKSLLENIKLYILSRFFDDSLIDELTEDNYEEKTPKIQYFVRTLGAKAAKETTLLQEIISEILSYDGIQLFCFGQGLADGCAEPQKMWCYLCDQIALIKKEARNYQVLRGFLNAVYELNSELCEVMLDNTLLDSFLKNIYPTLQSSIVINMRGVARLKKSLKFDEISIWQYSMLAYGGVHRTINDVELCELLRLINNKPEGPFVAVEIMSMKVYDFMERKEPASLEISNCGQELLTTYPFSNKNDNTRSYDYELSRIILSCFTDQSSDTSAKIICTKLAKGTKDYSIHLFYYEEVIAALAKTKPEVFLDAFLIDNDEDDAKVKWFYSNTLMNNNNPLLFIDDDKIINWCEIEPQGRYKKVASAIIPFIESSGEASPQWTQLSVKIIEKSYDPITILDIYKYTLRPISIGAEKAKIMQNRICLISSLKANINPLIADWAQKAEREFENEILMSFEWEAQQRHEQDASFE